MAISIQRVEMSSSSTITRLLGVRPLLSCIQCPNTEYAFCTASAATGAAHIPPHISSMPSDPDTSLGVLNEVVQDINNHPILGCMSSHCTCNSPIINTSSAQHVTPERPMVNLSPLPSFGLLISITQLSPPAQNLSHISQCHVITSCLQGVKFAWRNSGGTSFRETNPVRGDPSLFTEWEVLERLRSR